MLRHCLLEWHCAPVSESFRLAPTALQVGSPSVRRIEIRRYGHPLGARGRVLRVPRPRYADPTPKRQSYIAGALWRDRSGLAAGTPIHRPIDLAAAKSA